MDRIQAQLHALPYWNGGQNHVVFNYENDWPNPGYDAGKAILIKTSMLNITYRRGFDVSMQLVSRDIHEPRPDVVHVGTLLNSVALSTHLHSMLQQKQAREGQQHDRPGNTSALHHREIHRKLILESPDWALGPMRAMTASKDALLTFKGCVPAFGGDICKHRVRIFGKWMPPSDRRDVLFQVQCCGDHGQLSPSSTLAHCAGCNDNRKSENGNDVSCTAAYQDFDMVDGLRRSKFGFAPRGCGSMSYRLLETMGEAGVPVMTGDGAQMPYDGEGNLGNLWDTCVLVVPEDQLGPGLLERLEAMSDEEYYTRLAACIRIVGYRSHSLPVVVQQGFCVIAHRLSAALRARAGGSHAAHERLLDWHLTWVHTCREVGVYL